MKSAVGGNTLQRVDASDFINNKLLETLYLKQKLGDSLAQATTVAETLKPLLNDQ